MLDRKRLSRFGDGGYRASYLEASVRSGISYQIKALRSKDNLSQKSFGQAIGVPQSVVSRLENPEYGKVTVQTLLDIAIARNVALVVRFVDYPTFFGFSDRMAEEDLQPDTVFESITKASTATLPFDPGHFMVEMTARPSSDIAANLKITSDGLTKHIDVRASGHERMFYVQ